MLKLLKALLLIIFLHPQGAQSLDQCHYIFRPDDRVLMPLPIEVRYTEPRPLDVTLFHESKSARVFVEMAQRKMLLHQSHRVLDAKGLLLPNGGLCAPTCLTNVLGAMTAQEGNSRAFLRNAPEITEIVVKAYSEYTGSDARLGVDVQILSEIAPSLMPEVIRRTQYDSLFSQLDITVGGYQQGLYPHLLFQKLKGDTMAIVSVRPVNPLEAGRDTGHAIIILKVDFDNKTILISDPNKPNEIIESPYFFTQGNDIAFRVPSTYGDHWVKIFQINTFSRVIHSFD